MTTGWTPLPVRAAAAIDAAKALAELLRWAAGGGAWFDPVEIRTTADGYRRGYARRAIAAGELLVVVPRRLLITDVDVLQAERVAPLGGFGGFLSSRRSPLGLWLALEIRDPRSPWRPYLDALPPAFPHLPAYRTDRALAALTGTRALAVVMAQAAGVRDDLELIHEQVGELGDVGLPDFAWGRSVAESRCFRMNGDDGSARALVPLVDLFDHGPLESIWRFHREANAFEIHAACDLAAGQEIHVSYGLHDNAWFVSSHGFAIADNPDDEIALRVGTRDVEVAAVLDQRFDRALTIAHAATDATAADALAVIATAARAAAEVLAAAPAAPDDDPAWRSLCAIVRAGEQAVLDAIVRFAERAAQPRSPAEWRALAAAIPDDAPGADQLLRGYALAAAS